jgi:hypothetical protein
MTRRVSDNPEHINGAIDKEISEKALKQGKETQLAQKDFDKKFDDYKKGNATWDDVDKSQKNLFNEKKDGEKIASAYRKDRAEGGYKQSDGVKGKREEWQKQQQQVDPASKKLDNTVDKLGKGEATSDDVKNDASKVEKERVEARMARWQYDKEVENDVGAYRKKIGLD